MSLEETDTLEETVEYEGDTYYSISTAAKLAGLTENQIRYLLRTDRKRKNFTVWNPIKRDEEKVGVDVVRDQVNGRRYISEDSVCYLKFRFMPIGAEEWQAEFSELLLATMNPEMIERLYT